METIRIQVEEVIHSERIFLRVEAELREAELLLQKIMLQRKEQTEEGDLLIKELQKYQENLIKTEEKLFKMRKVVKNGAEQYRNIEWKLLQWSRRGGKEEL